jgi:enamine deaminase RidA (YjgF/YER057c/UK114 family)
MTYEHINPEELGAPRGWTNGMLAPADGRVLFVAGQDAAEVGGEVATDDFVEQFDLVLGKVLTIVRAAGGGPEDVGRMTIFVTELDEYRSGRREIGERYRAHMGKHFPAMALVEVRGLLDPGAKVEIEATAVIRHSSA